MFFSCAKEDDSITSPNTKEIQANFSFSKNQEHLNKSRRYIYKVVNPKEDMVSLRYHLTEEAMYSNKLLTRTNSQQVINSKKN